MGIKKEKIYLVKKLNVEDYMQALSKKVREKLRIILKNNKENKFKKDLTLM